MSARAIQICGTGSGVGKSVITAGLCRIFLQDGFRVAPFKAQNMALNSYVTRQGGEIGRAQAVQAMACRIEPTVEMNPILLKPSSDRRAQVILKGKPFANLSAVEYKRYKSIALKEVVGSYKKLASNFDLVVIEGAGSPAEVNLRAHDIVNMRMAEIADAPVVLVGDIDRGGVFAWIVGTLELLTAQERNRVKAIIINKFRGDKRLLRSGIDFLEKKTGVKVAGVIPYFKDIKIAEEDSLSVSRGKCQVSECQSVKEKAINISVVRLPYMSNFTDFDALMNEPDVLLRYVEKSEDLDGPDVIILPGSKNTISDLLYLKKSGIASRILSTINHKPSTILIGICGGYQMLGVKIKDDLSIESSRKEIDGLGLLPIETEFKGEKMLAQVKARETGTGEEVTGYEIHHGKSKHTGKCLPVFEILERRSKKINVCDGARSADGRVWGTYIHGVFDGDGFRRAFLNTIRAKKGLAPMPAGASFDQDAELDKLAKLIRENVDVGFLRKVMTNGYT